MSLTERDNFIYLTAALVLLLLGTAMVDYIDSGFGQHLIGTLTIVTLFTAIWGIRSRRVWHKTAIGLAGAMALVVVLRAAVDSVSLQWLYLVLLLVFFLFAGWQTAHQILFTGPVDGNKIIGAIALYLLIGLVWALLYAMLDLMMPGAFSGIDSDQWATNIPDFTYFSFVALSTLGFGDISPINPVARALVYLEALFGQFYLAILVASLIGIRLTAGKPQGRPDNVHTDGAS